MNGVDAKFGQSALVMRLIGWGIVIGLTSLLFIYPPGFLWGAHPQGFPFVGPPHGQSHLDGTHPYLFMLWTMYAAWGILLIRGAKDPLANAALFDFGILANFLHGLVMVPQSLQYPNEIAHLWADIPLCFAVCAILWIWHPSRIFRRQKASAP